MEILKIINYNKLLIKNGIDYCREQCYDNIRKSILRSLRPNDDSTSDLWGYWSVGASKILPFRASAVAGAGVPNNPGK